MTRNEILDRAARAMLTRFDPDHAARLDDDLGRPGVASWARRALDMYRERFAVGLDAVEADIRRDERERLATGLRALDGRIISIELAAAFVEQGKRLSREPVASGETEKGPQS